LLCLRGRAKKITNPAPETPDHKKERGASAAQDHKRKHLTPGGKKRKRAHCQRNRSKQKKKTNTDEEERIKRGRGSRNGRGNVYWGGRKKKMRPRDWGRGEGRGWGEEKRKKGGGLTPKKNRPGFRGKDQKGRNQKNEIGKCNPFGRGQGGAKKD